MTVWVEIAGQRRRVELPANEAGSPTTVVVDGKQVEADICVLGDGVLSLVIGGRQFQCMVQRDADGDAVIVAGKRVNFSVADPRSLAGQTGAVSGSDGPRAVKASMPGRVVRILAAVGDEVEKDQGLVVIEAMKMQNELKSPKAGRISRIVVAVGDTVAAGAVLIAVE
jgi:biotin carboxyl carrier protein